MSKEDSSSGEAGPQDTSGADVSSDGPAKDPNADVYNNRGPKKIIRVVTVMAYLFSVSFVGILLSTYYLFLWEPPNPRLIAHLRADPQVEFLIAAAPPTEISDSKENDTMDFFLENGLNRTSISFLSSRMTEDTFDEDFDDPAQRQPDLRISFEKQRRLNALLLKLRQSLVEVLRAQKRNSSREAANKSDYSFVKMKGISNLTKETDHARRMISEHDESRGNITREQILPNDNASPPSELTDSINTLNVENTFPTPQSATIPGTKTNQNHFDGEFATGTDRHSTPIAIRRVRMHPNYKRKILRPSKYHTLRQGSARLDEADDRQSIAPVTDGETSPSHHDPNNVRSTIITTAVLLEAEYVENRNKNHLSSVNVNNSKFNDLSDGKSSSKYFAHDRVSIESPADTNLIEDQPEFHHQPIAVKRPLYVASNTEETQMEKMTARSTTMDDKRVEEMEFTSSTERQRGLWGILAETADIKDTSAELTSISTTRNYRTNLTSTANDDDESVT